MTLSWLADKIERWPTAKLVPYARNARTHSDCLLYTSPSPRDNQPHLVCRLLLESLNDKQREACLLYTSDAADECCGV